MQLINSQDGSFHDGNPATGAAGTPLAAAWHNAVQGEIAAVVLAAGLALDPNNNAQMLTAIEALIEARSGNYLLDTGAANACVVALNPQINAYANGLPIKFRIAHSISGASTLNAGAGPVSLLRDDGTPTQNGDGPVGSIVSATFDATANGFLINSIVPSQVASLVAAILGASPVLGGAPTGTTPPLLDNSTKLATTAFVQQRGFSNCFAYNANTTLTNAVANAAVQCFGPPGTTFTLPVGSTMPVASFIWFFSQGAGTLIVTTQGDDSIWSGASAQPITLQKGDTLLLMSRGGNEWDVIGGTAALQFVNGPRMSSPVISGLTTISGNGSGATNVQISDPGNANGANVRVTGNGSVTPSKSVRVANGRYQVINDAYSAAILDMDDSGNLSVMGTVSASTQPQFDSSTKAATTAFVQRNGLAFQQGAGVGISTNTTIGLGQLGSWGALQAPGLTATLPALASCPLGSTFTVQGGTYGGTFKANGTEIINYANGSTGNTYPVLPGETLTFVANTVGGGGWYVVECGFGSPSFGSSLSTNGYQKLPSGLLLQWGQASGSSPVTITYPIAFAAGVFAILAAPNASANTTYGINTASVSLSQFNAYPNAASAGANAAFSWIAFGR